MIYSMEWIVKASTGDTKGRCLRGARVGYIVEGHRGQNLTICLAISLLIGLVHSSTVIGGMTQELFSEFLMELAALHRVQEEQFFVLCDNARAHGNAPNMGDQAEVVYLPKYAPYLNACEMAGSCLKAAIKQCLTEPNIQQEIYNRDNLAGETLQARRLRVLRREVRNCVGELTPQKCEKWCGFTMRYVPLCIRGEDIFDWRLRVQWRFWELLIAFIFFVFYMPFQYLSSFLLLSFTQVHRMLHRFSTLMLINLQWIFIWLNVGIKIILIFFAKKSFRRRLNWTCID